ncbi:MAG: alkaline phosphatase family protein [Burkholderiales bacterium]
MATVRNILFVMCDQLRADHLSCYGHPRLKTPNIDRIAALGTRFTRCYVQGPICGPSRMSFYTGRYVMSHGATWNFVPLPAGERTLGDYLRQAGLRTAVAGKTHAAADAEGIERLGLHPREGKGLLVAEAGFEPLARDDGIVTEKRAEWAHSRYNEFLKAKGYPGGNPWHDFANSGANPDGSLASGWHMRNARLPARVPEADSETAWTTDRAIEFIREQAEQPWCLHLSYIKPHWPYIAPAPYHSIFGPEDCAAPLRDPREREDAHPVFRAFRGHPAGRAFSREEVRRNVVPTYMGLVKQIDDHLGRVLVCLKKFGRMDDTLIVFTSDHGDYLGDHWLGEKELFYEQSVRVPLIISDPSPQALRGATSDALVEAIDLLPTFIDALGRPVPGHILEGHSLLPLLHGGPASSRQAVFSELDYSFYAARRELGVAPLCARAVMARTQDWKLVHYDAFPPQLFDLRTDPQELEDLGANSGTAHARRQLQEHMFEWMRARRNRITMSDAQGLGSSGNAGAGGVIIGEW